MMRHCDVAGSFGSAARRCGATLSVLLALGSTAGAELLKIPRDRPQVELDVPDGWSVERSSFAVEMRAPEKNAIVVASVLAQGKSSVDGWTKHAGERLKAFGVQFDTSATAPPKVPEPIKSAEDVQREKAEADAKSAFTTNPDAFTFSGAPSLKMPGTEGSNKPVKPADNSIEGLTSIGSKGALSSVPTPSVVQAPMPKLPFKAVQIYGATLNGKPVDVQLVIYSLPGEHLFVMMQESGSDDGRTVALAQSVRRAE